MSDALVLNLALEEGTSTRGGSAKKGGRWTDRCVEGLLQYDLLYRTYYP
jgi:hypothetical protein